MDLAPIIIAVSSAVTALVLAAVFAAGWCAARRGGRAAHPGTDAGDEPSAATRITLADLRARLRRLEAIASGVEL